MKYKLELNTKASNCGTGAGGFSAGNSCASGSGSGGGESGGSGKRKMDEDTEDEVANFAAEMAGWGEDVSPIDIGDDSKTARLARNSYKRITGEEIDPKSSVLLRLTDQGGSSKDTAEAIEWFMQEGSPKGRYENLQFGGAPSQRYDYSEALADPGATRLSYESGGNKYNLDVVPILLPKRPHEEDNHVVTISKQ